MGKPSTVVADVLKQPYSGPWVNGLPVVRWCELPAGVPLLVTALVDGELCVVGTL